MNFFNRKGAEDPEQEKLLFLWLFSATLCNSLRSLRHCGECRLT